MFNAKSAKEMVKNYKANEKAKLEEYARLHVAHIGEDIKALAEKGETHMETSLQGDLQNVEMRTLVVKTLKGYGYYVRADFYGTRIYIAW